MEIIVNTRDIAYEDSIHDATALPDGCFEKQRRHHQFTAYLWWHSCSFRYADVEQGSICKNRRASAMLRAVRRASDFHAAGSIVPGTQRYDPLLPWFLVYVS